MFNSILVPVDISESRLTEQVIPYVQANAAIGNGKIHFSDGSAFISLTIHRLGWRIRLKCQSWRRFRRKPLRSSKSWLSSLIYLPIVWRHTPFQVRLKIRS